MRGYKAICCALGCVMSFTTAIVVNVWDGRSFTGISAHASVLSHAFPARLDPLPDKTNYLIQVASDDFQVMDAGGPPDTAIPIQIQLPFKIGAASDAATKYTFLMFRGLPKGFKLSSGFVTKNAYIVSISKYQNISIIPPENFKGKFPLRVLLYKGNNIPPIERLITVSIGIDDTQTGSTSESFDTSNTATISKPTDDELKQVPKLKITPENEASSLAQAQEFIENGNIVYARLIYEDLAMQGSAHGAYSMGQTFDPEFLSKISAIGLQPDIETAKKWYKKAAKRGNQSAISRLNAIKKEGH